MIQLRTLLFVFSVSILLFSCTSSRYASVHDIMEAQKKPVTSVYEAKMERKIIFSADISLATENPDTTNANLLQIAKKYKGYVQDISSRKTVMRVQKEYLNQAIQEISLLGKVLDKNMNAQDVSEEFLDYQIRLDNAQKIRLRYLELLKKAENVEEALKVEKELERINETIELLKGRINRMNHLSELSTIRIHLKEEKKTRPFRVSGNRTLQVRKMDVCTQLDANSNIM